MRIKKSNERLKFFQREIVQEVKIFFTSIIIKFIKPDVLMPLYKTITISNDTKVFIWKIDESVEDLQKDICITDNCELRISSMKSQIHQKGFLSVRQLLKTAGYDVSSLYYD